MQYSQTFQFLLFTRHHQEFCFSTFFLLFTCKLGLQKFIWVDVGMSFRIINFLKYPNNAIVFDSRLINAINFLPNWCVLQIFFHKYISFKFKALFLHINWQCSSLACVTNSTSSGSSDTVSLSWIQCKFNRANMYLSTFRETATNQNSQFENNRGQKTWGFLEKSCFTFCDFHWVLFLTVQWHLWFWKERKKRLLVQTANARLVVLQDRIWSQFCSLQLHQRHTAASY